MKTPELHSSTLITGEHPTPNPPLFPTEQTIFLAPEQTPSRIPSAQAIDAEVPEILTHLEDYPFAKTKDATIGDIQIAYGTWGKKRGNSFFKKTAQRLGIFTPETAESIKKTGFPAGYYYTEDADMFSPKFQALQAVRGAMLAKTVADHRGWTHIHTLALGSISSVADTPKRVAAILGQWGITVDHVQFYGQACNSALAAIVDLTRLAQSGGDVSPSVVVGLESLSGNQTDPKDIRTMRTFGNGGGAIAFVPGRDIEHITGRTIFVKDEKGVIKIPRIYEVPTSGRVPLYPWYEVPQEGEDGIAMTKEGIFVQMVPPEGNYAHMDGRETFKWFARHVPELVADVVMTYAKTFGAKHGKLWRWALGHQPAKPVNTGIVEFTNKHLERLKQNLGEQTLAQTIARHLPKRIQIPWLMHRAGINNVSAATCLVNATEMINRGMIRQNKPTLLVGYGIGSVMQADIVIFH